MFQLATPDTTSPSHSPQPPETSPAPEAPDARPKRQRVLIVDDDVGTLEGFGAVLRTAGFDVATAASGSKALALVDEGFDVILLDLRLGEIDGLDVLRDLRATYASSRVVIVTGFGSIKSAVRAMKLGAFDFVEKPLSEDDLVDVVRRALAAPEGWIATPEEDRSEPGIQVHAAARWAEAVFRVIELPNDPKTVTAWGRAIGASRATLRNRCRAVDLSAKRSLDLGRVLRAVHLARLRGWPPEQVLDVVDRRTLRHLLASTGLLGRKALPSLSEILESQSLVANDVAIDELSRLVTRTLPHGL